LELRAQLEETGSDLANEKTARQQSESKCEDALHDVAAAKERVVALEDATGPSGQSGPQVDGEDAAAQLTALCQEIEELQAHAAQLNGELSQEKTARLDADKQRDEALHSAAEIQANSVSLDEHAELQSRTKQLEAELAGEQQARLDVEMQHDGALQALADERESAISQEQLEELQTRSEHLEASASREQVARLAVEAELEQAVQTATDAQAEIAALQDAAEAAVTGETEAKEREIIAQEAVCELRQRIELLETELAQEQSNRLEVEARLASAIEDAASARAQTASGQELIDQLLLAQHREGEARSREAEAQHKIIELEERTRHLEAVITGEQEARLDIHNQLEEALQSAAAAQQHALELQSMPEPGPDLEQQKIELDHLTAVAQQEVCELQARAEALEAEIAKEQAVRLEAETRLLDSQQNATAMQEQLTALQDALEQSQLAAQSGTEVPDTDASSVDDTAEWRLRAEQFEAAVSREQVARLAAETLRVEAEQNAAMALEQMQAMQDALEQAQQAQLRNASAAVSKADAAAEVADLRFAADKPVFVKNTKGAKKSPAKPKQSAPAGEKPERKDERVSTRISGTIQKDTELTVLSCTIQDKSASGAKIDIVPDKYNASIGMPDIGDGLTLTFKTPWETNTVECEVMWLAGTLCGLKYTGPIHTQVDQPKKRAPKKPPSEASTVKKTSGPKRSTGRRKTALLPS